MKSKEIRELTDAELEKKLEDLKGDIFKMRFKKATAQLENPMNIRLARRDIARVMTVLSERKKKAAVAKPAAGAAK